MAKTARTKVLHSFGRTDVPDRVTIEWLHGHPGGLSRVNQQAIKTEQNLDCKYLLRTNEPTL